MYPSVFLCPGFCFCFLIIKGYKFKMNKIRRYLYFEMSCILVKTMDRCEYMKDLFKYKDSLPDFEFCFLYIFILQRQF